MQQYNTIIESVNRYISNLPYDRQPQSLYEPIKYVLSLGGKRIRPVLMLLAYNMYRDDPDTIMPQACALETYHNYTLLHDDLMDNADVRRGHPTVHRRWDANTAVLSGDTMLVLAYQRMAQCSPRHLPLVMQLFSETALEIGEGQQYDMDFERRDDVTEEEYIEMIRLKTSVLLACATKMGALLADAPQQDADTLYRYGELVGLAFQLQDDYLDVYGDPKVFGKEIGGDITSNKKTYMLINALLRGNDTQREELTRWINLRQFDKQEKIAAVTRLYNDIGIDRLATERINLYFDESRKILDSLPIASDRKEQMAAFTNEMMNRER